MDAKQIEMRTKALGKAHAANEPATVIIGLLRELQTGVKPTEDLLRSTRVGIFVNKLKQHKSPDVARLSSEMVSKWRAEVNKQKAAGARNSPHPAGKAGASSVTSPAQASTPPDSIHSSVPPEKRSWRADGVQFESGNKARDACIGLMYDALAQYRTETPATVLSKAKAIEAAAFSAFGPESGEKYKAKMRSLFSNLRQKNNPGLRVRVLTDDIKPDRFVKMSLEELKSAERREEDARIKKENMDKAMVAQAERSISTSLQCGKCQQRKVSYSQAQTRSADEPMTTFCECTNCGKFSTSIVICLVN